MIHNEHKTIIDNVSFNNKEISNLTRYVKEQIPDNVAYRPITEKY